MMMEDDVDEEESVSELSDVDIGFTIKPQE